eukprot:2130883-Prymnesium_polylepis.1
MSRRPSTPCSCALSSALAHGRPRSGLSRSLVRATPACAGCWRCDLSRGSRVRVTERPPWMRAGGPQREGDSLHTNGTSHALRPGSLLVQLTACRDTRTPA